MHTHSANATSIAATASNPADYPYACQGIRGQPLRSKHTNLTALDAQAIPSVGGSQAHLNIQPFLVLNFCIALQGIFQARPEEQ